MCFCSKAEALVRSLETEDEAPILLLKTTNLWAVGRNRIERKKDMKEKIHSKSLDININRNKPTSHTKQITKIKKRTKENKQTRREKEGESDGKRLEGKDSGRDLLPRERASFSEEKQKTKNKQVLQVLNKQHNQNYPRIK